MPEVIPIGADHAGYALKERLVSELRRLGYEPLDLGTHSTESTDYPEYAHEVAARVEHHDAERSGTTPLSGRRRSGENQQGGNDSSEAAFQHGGQGSFEIRAAMAFILSGSEFGELMPS